jgi:hypothetical protein
VLLVAVLVVVITVAVACVVDMSAYRVLSR